jgi:predicted ester cyclase
MADPNSVEKNKALIRRFWELVFNKGDMSPIDEMIGPQYTYNGHPTTAEGTKKWAEHLRASVPDIHFTILDLLGEGDKVAIRWRADGHDPKTSTAITTSATNIITLVDGKAISNWQNGGTSFQPAGGTTS